ncbi:transposase [Streptomyces sp. NPDC056053]|uniref:transposase n=1 Tax=Streptomyces sp. NPDC056053 TaxID=3345696 RepID=UPI0035D9A564
MTDDERALLKPLLPVSNNRYGRWRDHHQVITGIIHRLGTGVQWRELPERFGPRRTVHKRHAPWSADGTWEMLLQHVQSQVHAKGGIDRDVSVDSTAMRAHQHAAEGRAGDQQAETVPGRGDPLRQARIPLPRHHHCGGITHLAPIVIEETGPSRAWSCAVRDGVSS